jgi:hypothetical protein
MIYSLRKDLAEYFYEEGSKAALNDLQGKVDGLLVALETIPLCAGISTEDGPKASVIAKKALAEFKKDPS